MVVYAIPYLEAKVVKELAKKVMLSLPQYRVDYYLNATFFCYFKQSQGASR